MVKKATSPAMSLKGFKFTKNFGSSCRNLIFSAVGLLVSQLVFNNYVADGIAILGMNILGKSLQYFFKKYE